MKRKGREEAEEDECMDTDKRTTRRMNGADKEVDENDSSRINTVNV